MTQPTLRTCPYCGSKKRRLLRCSTHRLGHRVWHVMLMQCYNAGCGLWRAVEVAY